MKKIISCFTLLAFIMCVIGINHKTNQPSAPSPATVPSPIPKTTMIIHADYPVHTTAQDLIDSADLVFQGVITESEYEMLDIRTNKDDDFDEDDLMPYTLYTIDISHIYKGTTPNSTITIKCPGGIFEDTEYVLAENPLELSIGSDYLFLADTYENSYPSLVNVTQAAYDINAPQTVSDVDGIQITLTEILALLGDESE